MVIIIPRAIEIDHYWRAYARFSCALEVGDSILAVANAKAQLGRTCTQHTYARY